MVNTVNNAESQGWEMYTKRASQRLTLFQVLTAFPIPDGLFDCCGRDHGDTFI